MAASLNQKHPVVWLEQRSLSGSQRLGLTPSMGGSVATWALERTGFAPFDLFRPWDCIFHADPLQIGFASYPLAPWSNRISHGGFSVDGKFHTIATNTDLPYPIHGDAWQQHWQYQQHDAVSLEMTLESNQFNGNPYHYRALQTFKLVDGGMDQTLTVTHLGNTPLPYGLGQHPWLPRNELTTVHAQVIGVWLSHPDCLPKEHTSAFSPSWDLKAGIFAAGSLIDNCFTGWDGIARVTWPDQMLQLTLNQTQLKSIGTAKVSAYSTPPNYLVLFRKATGDHFCLEPVSHPIDAFHLPGQAGLQMLKKGESLTLALSWRFTSVAT